MRLLGLDKEELQSVIALIQSLSPRPGAQSHGAPAQYVVPDVFVRKVRDVWQVELNADAFPRLRVNPFYASLVRRADNSAGNATMRGQLQEARWFIKSLKSRSETLPFARGAGMRYRRSMMVTLAWPPPSHMVWNP